MKRALVLLLTVFCGISVWGQDVPKVEIPIGFSMINVHPNLSPITSFNVFGGGGQVDFNFGNVFGIKADFMGYTQGSGLRNQLQSLGYAGQVNGNMFTYMFGPQIKKHSGRVQPFAEFLFGAAHTNAYASIYNAVHGVTSASSNNNAFAMALGGGIDMVAGRHLSLRPVEVDYLYTRFGINGTSYTGNQNNFRYVGGIVLTMGGAPPVPPTASCSASPSTVLEGEPVKLTATGSNFNPKHPVTYAWNGNGAKISGTNAQSETIDTTGMAGDFAKGILGKTTSYTGSATLTDPKEKKNNSATCTANYTVNPRPVHPPVVSCSASPNALAINQSGTVTMTASSPDNRPLIYSWSSAGGQFSGSGTSGTLVATNADAGSSITVTGTATDDRKLSTSCTTSVTVPPVQKVAEVENWGECTFEKDPKRPWRVDNDCKDVLDKLALRIQQMPGGKVVVVGYKDQTEVVNAEQIGAQRAVNIKYYMTTDELGPKVDASRLEVKQGGTKGKASRFYYVPQGATLNEEESVTIDESVVQGQSRSSAQPKRAKHK